MAKISINAFMNKKGKLQEFSLPRTFELSVTQAEMILIIWAPTISD